MNCQYIFLFFLLGGLDPPPMKKMRKMYWQFIQRNLPNIQKYKIERNQIQLNQLENMIHNKNDTKFIFRWIQALALVLALALAMFFCFFSLCGLPPPKRNKWEKQSQGQGQCQGQCQCQCQCQCLESSKQIISMCAEIIFATRSNTSPTWGLDRPTWKIERKLSRCGRFFFK